MKWLCIAIGVLLGLPLNIRTWPKQRERSFAPAKLQPHSRSRCACVLGTDFGTRTGMSIDRKRTETLFGLVCDLVASGQPEFRPGDICTLLRERNQPMGAWMVRLEFSNLEDEGLIAVDPASGAWRRTGQAVKPDSDAA